MSAEELLVVLRESPIPPLRVTLTDSRTVDVRHPIVSVEPIPADAEAGGET